MISPILLNTAKHGLLLLWTIFNALAKEVNKVQGDV
jgi:hypothetical protein